MKTMVKDLQQGQQIEADFLVTDTKEGTTSRGSSSLHCTLRDKSGNIRAVCWEHRPGTVEAGEIYHIAGAVSEYQGQPQIKINTFTPRLSSTDEDFLPVSQYPIEEMWARVLEHLESIGDERIRTVARDILCMRGYDEAFKKSPAASFMHHSFQGGLLEHTVQLLDLADVMLKLPFMGQTLCRDLVIFGVMFHDFGKVFEYSSDAGFKLTMQGILVPHIPMTAAIVFETCNKFEVPEVVRDHLMHVVLAHHGRPDYGSAVEMNLPEAVMVYHLDHMHGDVFGWTQMFAGSKEDLFKHPIERRLLVAKPFSKILEETRGV